MRAIAVAAIVLISGSLSPVRGQAPDAAQALRSRVEAFQTAWNAYDASAVAAFFADEADQIMEAGPTIRGHQAIQQWWRDRFASIERGRKIALGVSSIRLITADVALVNTTAKGTGGRNAQGQEVPPENDRGTWVLIRQGGQWLITALRVQPAEEGAAR